jgi:hypothetical protein
MRPPGLRGRPSGPRHARGRRLSASGPKTGLSSILTATLAALQLAAPTEQSAARQAAPTEQSAARLAAPTEQSAARLAAELAAMLAMQLAAMLAVQLAARVTAQVPALAAKLAEQLVSQPKCRQRCVKLIPTHSPRYH